MFDIPVLYLQIACHIQDLPENGADIHHLPAVHTASIAVSNCFKQADYFLLWHVCLQIGGDPSTWLEYLSNLVNWHEWGISWCAGDKADGRGHIADINLRQLLKINVLGMQFTPLDFNVRIYCTCSVNVPLLESWMHLR